MKFSMDTAEMKMLEHKMRLLRKSAFAAATENTINQMAFEAMREGKRQTRTKFINRNQHTVRGVQVTPSSSSIIARQASIVGTVRGYMRVQQRGGLKHGKGSASVNLLTPIGAGQPKGTRPRTKLALRQHRHDRLKLEYKNVRGNSERQRNAVRIRQAASQGKAFVYLETQQRSGIYEVYGSEKNPTVNLIWDLSHRTVRIPATDWWTPTEQAGINSRNKHWMRSLRYQLRKAGIR